MSKAKAKKGEDDVTEIFELDPSRIDGVRQAATRLPFLLIKSVAPVRGKAGAFGRKLSPKAREVFAANAERVRRRERPKPKKKRSRIARPSVAAKAASSGEIPATGVSNEAASIMASVTASRPDGVVQHQDR